MCAMEMVAWLAGESHSDEPACACPVIGAVVRCLNDALPSAAERERLLRPLVPTLVNSRSTPTIEQARALLLADWAARKIAPAILRRTYRDGDARTLAQSPPVRTRADAFALLRHLHGAEVKAVRWVVQRAAENELSPRLWAAGVVWAAKDVGRGAGWQIVADLVRALTALGASTPAASSGQRLSSVEAAGWV